MVFMAVPRGSTIFDAIAAELAAVSGESPLYGHL
jgi:hypothetical protein